MWRPVGWPPPAAFAATASMETTGRDGRFIVSEHAATSASEVSANVADLCMWHSSGIGVGTEHPANGAAEAPAWRT